MLFAVALPHADADSELPVTNGLELWLDAADESTIMVDGAGKVSKWTDKSAQGYDAEQSDSTKQPSYTTRSLNNIIVIEFDGQHYLTTPKFSSKLKQPNTIVVVGKRDTSDGDGYYFYDGLDKKKRHANFVENNNYSVFAGKKKRIISYAEAATEPEIHISRFNEDFSQNKRDGALVASGNAGRNKLQGLTIGARYVGKKDDHTPQDYLDGYIAELLVYNRALSVAESIQVQAYLEDKWDIAPELDPIQGLEGFGTSTPGGNNGGFIEVNSLADAGNGTLRAALAQGNNYRIVFTVGGTINLQSFLEIRGQSFLTIDGASAPPPGITLQGRALAIRNSHDIIVSHIRVRDSATDGILVWDGSSDVVIDHCSVTNSVDENISVTEDTSYVTLSWNIIGDTRPDSFTLDTKGSLIANFDKPSVTHVSIHHNLYINELRRSPQVSTEGLVDIRNNVIRNWGGHGMLIRNGAWGNIINNVFDTELFPQHAVLLTSNGFPDAGPMYIEGNQGPGSVQVDDLSTAPSAFTVAPVTTQPANEVEEKVLRNVGALPRDALDFSLAGPSGTP
jgi:pectate lyase